MILVLLGTHELQFTRVLDEVEKCIDRGLIKEKVLVQAGNTKYKSDKMDIIDYISYEEMNKLMEEARIVITHGGTGSIVDSLKMRKKVIAVPRLKKYNEHNDDHQIEIVNEFEKKGYIMSLQDGGNLCKIIEGIEKFIPEAFISGNAKIINIIEEFITNGR